MATRRCIALCVAALAFASPVRPARAAETINDITQLNPIVVGAVVSPTTEQEVSRLVAGHSGPISIGGARHSQGGQTACPGCLFIDMRRLNRVISYDPQRRLITVQAGMTWRALQEVLDRKNQSVAIMQDYANFTVGGTLSVNAHGAYVDRGPVINSVRSFRIVLADGTLETASREQNPEVFYGAIGGYGGLGVIVDATLELADNRPLERVAQKMKVEDYRAFFRDKVEGRPGVVMHSAAIYPPEYRNVVTDTLSETDKALTITPRLASRARLSGIQLLMLDWVTRTREGKLFREYVYDPLHPRGRQVELRNYVASQDANGIEPPSRARSTYVLQEYFVPVDRFDDFAAKMAAVLTRNRANVLNLAIRHTPAETGTLLSWAPREMFCFVLYYEQGVTSADRAAVRTWTSQLIQLALDEGGDYYLPYQIVASRAQFLKAYPRAPEYFALKKRLDPTYKFRNSLWDAYYTP
jgi:FAD/FMN-containing dehydrogenase